MKPAASLKKTLGGLPYNDSYVAPLRSSAAVPFV